MQVFKMSRTFIFHKTTLLTRRLRRLRAFVDKLPIFKSVGLKSRGMGKHVPSTFLCERDIKLLPPPPSPSKLDRPYVIFHLKKIIWK